MEILPTQQGVRLWLDRQADAFQTVCCLETASTLIIRRDQPATGRFAAIEGGRLIVASGGKNLPATTTPELGRTIDPMLRVLVIEDEPIIGVYLQDLLSDFGVDVCGVAASGDAALALAAEHRPQVALVDIGLCGDLDGISVAQTMAERHGTAIVFLSGDAEAEHDPRVTALAPIAFLVKPYFPDQLETALAKATIAAA